MSNDNNKFWSAFHAAQMQMRDPVKDSKNPHFKSRFVSLKGVLDAVRGPLHSNGITVSQNIDRDEHGIFVVTKLMHTSGEGTQSRCPVICAKPNDPQALGSAITYARRYDLAAICGLAPADEDDDGNDAVGVTQQAAPQPRQQPKPVPTPKPVPPFDYAEEAVQAIEQTDDLPSLFKVGLRVKASGFTGTDHDTVKRAYEDRRAELEDNPLTTDRRS